MGAIDNLNPRSDVFWGEIAPCEHLVQIYGDDGVFLDTLEGFVGSGLRAGDSVVVIATRAHLHGLEERLRVNGVDLATARSQDQYIPLSAQETLDKFMVNGWPDEQLFTGAVTDLIARARGNGRKVRAFGEMVALLWARGHTAATVRLEHLWNKLLQNEKFPMFCAYPKVGFTQEMSASINELCAAHSKVLPG